MRASWLVSVSIQSSPPCAWRHLGLRSLFSLDIKTWWYLPPSKQWQSREHGNLRSLYELQAILGLWAPQIATIMIFWLIFIMSWQLEEPFWVTGLFVGQNACQFKNEVPKVGISFWLHTVVESSFKITSQELHSEESKYILGLPWSICFPSCAASAQVHCGQVQGQLGFASLNLDLALVDLRGVSGGLPDATPALVVQVKTWTWPELPEQGSVMYTFVTVWLIIMWAEYLCCKNTHIYVQCHSNIQGRCIFQWKHTLIIGQRQCRLRTLDQILWKNITLRVCHQYRPQGEFFNAFFVWISDS